jgi:lipopolysaccharide heptosyltransferase I
MEHSMVPAASNFNPISIARATAMRPLRILIVRLSALGDVIHGLPVACALRAKFPDATIGWVVEGRKSEVVAGHPALDHVIVAPRRWLRSWRATRDLRRRLRELEFDVAIDLQCLTKSAVAAWLSGAPRRIGMAGPDGREFSRWLNNELVAVEGRHVIERYVSLLRPLGIENPTVEYDLQERSDDARFADDHLRSANLLRRQFVVLNPGAGWPAKVWPAERYGEVAAKLMASHGLPSLAVWGGPDECPMAEEIVAASAGAARLAPPTNISQLAALCRRAALFLGSDTGPMHLAAAVGAPTVSLHGPSRAEYCGAYGPHTRTVQAVRDAKSTTYRRHGDDAAMRAITVEMAVAACNDLLRRPYERRVG